MSFLGYLCYTKRQLAFVGVGFIIAVLGSMVGETYFFGWIFMIVGLELFYYGVKGDKSVDVGIKIEVEKK